VVVLAVYSLRAGTTELRAIALAALGPIVVAVLALLAFSRAAPGYLDIALVIAMLGAAQTITIVRTVEKHQELEK
jgi:multisubunit Na+/H+ antiporter MnhF subunit